MDGIDAALARFGPGEAGSIELVAFHTFPYDDELAEALRSLGPTCGAASLALLNVAVGEAFAVAARGLLERAAISADQVACIGSHGQTIVHVPEPTGCAGTFARATMQIGEPAVIAERTGLKTVADFRSRDMAAGGQGAPLVPLLDHRLYADDELGRVALNVGGIANVTGLPPSASLNRVRAFDTGPGNVLLDAASRQRGLPQGFDMDGAVAGAGSVDRGLLAQLLEHPFLAAGPPKSADLADFAGEYAAHLWAESAGMSDEDLLATLTELTAVTVVAGIDEFIAVRQPVDQVIISGGGAHNLALTARLDSLLGDRELVFADAVGGIPGDAKEAVAFALLANETLAGRPGNVVGATGASGPRVLGTIVTGSHESGI